MEFTFTPLQLMPVTIAIFAVVILRNRKAVAEKNRRLEGHSREPEARLSSRHDPKGQLAPLVASGMLVIAAALFVAIGTGFIET